MRSLRKPFGLACLGLFLAMLAACESSTDGDPAADPAQDRNVPCTSDATCDTAHGFACVDGMCLYACESHFDCTTIGLCRNFERGSFCSVDAEPQPQGQYYTNCPNGGECDTDSGFYCVGSGVGDLDSYCTNDCTDDVDCPTGFFCESVNATPCEDICDVIGQPSNPACVPSSEIGEGKPYRCTPVGLVRDQCVKRRFCAECETDEDCRSSPGLICATDLSGAKICTPPCDLATNSCPWGNAAVCVLTDMERGIPTCSHRFESCKGTGAPCEPCTRDRDCRETGFCYGSSFTGERYCIDFAPEALCSCADERVSGGVCTGGGCPETPGYLEMLCYVGSDSSADGLCYGANSTENPLLSSPQTGCWPPL